MASVCFPQEADNHACDSAIRQEPNFTFTEETAVPSLEPDFPGFGSSSWFAHL